MEIPQHLQHKPIIGVNNYDKLDGQYKNKSDAKALSIGQAQYDEDEFSAKVFRYTGEKWSRQSEELPIHRVLDLAILIIASMLTEANSLKSNSNLNEKIIDHKRLQGLSDYFTNNSKIINPRLTELRRLLDIYFAATK